MPRPVEEVTVGEDGYETHPAFGVAILSTPSNHPGVSLFQSDLQHRHTVTLEIRHATRERDLSNDWVHPVRMPLIEIEMSQAQWAQLVSSNGRGGGTPITLRSYNGERIPSVPFEPRTKQSVDELKSSVDTLLAELKEAVAEMNQLEDSKAPMKERRAARAKVSRLVDYAPGTVGFVAEQLNEHVEKVVTQAKADIEAMVTEASTGVELSERSPRLEIL